MDEEIGTNLRRGRGVPVPTEADSTGEAVEEEKGEEQKVKKR